MPRASKTFKNLLDFIRNRMRMSHIYQPVMLRTLLKNKGRASKKKIAAEFLKRDQSQLDYYARIVNAMPGKVLKSHGLVSYERREQAYTLEGFAKLSTVEIEQLVAAAYERYGDYIARREDLWAHRNFGRRSIPGSVRYEVFKRAGFRCELCGVSADVLALEVDHIIPKSKGGTDDLSNLQALCYVCNAQKGNKDDTDFRGMAKAYSIREAGCPFCEMTTPKGKVKSDRVLHENELAIAIDDISPVSPGHTLIIPKRHVAGYFDLYQPERNALDQLLKEVREELMGSDSSIEGFNLGVNVGEVAGQTVPHVHMHLIPRRKGDQKDPRFGVRKIFPDKANYKD